MAAKTGTGLVTHGNTLQSAQVPIPQLEPHQILVRVRSVAQNPTDVQCLDLGVFDDGAVLGCDFVGIAEELGDKVSSVHVGDRIAGLIWGGEIPGLGAYSQYTIADEGICFKVPEAVSSNDAATVPLAAATAWLALFSEDSLNIPRGKGNATPILIWGGSSSVGVYAIQLARRYSIPVVTVCSPRHFDYCKSLGATHVFDYHDPGVVEAIKSAVPNITHVFDCIGSPSSSPTASRTISRTGGSLCTVRPGKAFTDTVMSGVKVVDVLVWTLFLKDHQYKEFKYPASIADNNLGIEIFELIPKWLADGTLRTNKSRLLPGGLDAVSQGFQMHRDGKVSGFKLVYELLS